MGGGRALSSICTSLSRMDGGGSEAAVAAAFGSHADRAPATAPPAAHHMKSGKLGVRAFHCPPLAPCTAIVGMSAAGVGEAAMADRVVGACGDMPARSAHFAPRSTASPPQLPYLSARSQNEASSRLALHASNCARSSSPSATLCASCVDVHPLQLTVSVFSMGMRLWLVLSSCAVRSMTLGGCCCDSAVVGGIAFVRAAYAPLLLAAAAAWRWRWWWWW